MFQMLGGNGLFVFAEELKVRNGHTNGDTHTHTQTSGTYLFSDVSLVSGNRPDRHSVSI